MDESGTHKLIFRQEKVMFEGYVRNSLTEIKRLIAEKI